MLAELAQHDNESVKLHVARNPQTPPSVLKWLARDWHGRRGAVDNPNTPLTEAEWLIEEGLMNVKQVANSVHERELWRTLVEKAESYRRDEAARDSKTPPEVLSQLAGDRFSRRSVAQNINTPAAALAQLARDEDFYVRRNVAERKDLGEAFWQIYTSLGDVQSRKSV